ncbi:MAG: ATP-binding protein [Alloprevotella sp.]
MISRSIEAAVRRQIGQGKAIVIVGARQVGKSTLLQQIFGGNERVMWMNGDEQDIRALLQDITSTRMRALLGTKKILVIDEAQRIPDIGLCMKLITDQLSEVQVVATGSSAFELSSKVNESLAGRKRQYQMYPLSFAEMADHHGLLDELRLLPHRLVYGYYPEVVSSPGEERVVLKELTDSYLYKDVLSLDGVSKPDKLVRLLQALAFQIGSQVSYNELGSMVGLDSKTVERYVDILEKAYIVFRLGSFSRNLRNELKQSRKIYFWDLGIRNAVIGNLAQVELRADVGELWENYAIAERLKRNAYNNSFALPWFWRTKTQNEIDYLELEDGQIRSFEFKWNERKANVGCPATFAKAYPEASFHVVTPKNIESFLLS